MDAHGGGCAKAVSIAEVDVLVDALSEDRATFIKDLKLEGDGRGGGGEVLDVVPLDNGAI